MFCPSCGFADNQSNQFCRACGANLSLVRSALAKPDNITQSAISAREEIGRAVAAKIRETDSVGQLKKVAEDVLPEIEKFLESPEEKRLRRVRTGTIITCVGLGAAIAFSIIAALGDKDLAVLAGLGFVTFLIGLGFVINGLLFTVPQKTLSDKSSEADKQRELDTSFNLPTNQPDAQTNDLSLPEPKNPFSSVTEGTTKHLKEKIPVERR
ncbi:MAG: zinc ribbon domain-containing protein [Pyrinomonadaceae bacterium]|nr:zinc ribbon domain-containing protein [Pyrinomonadaceae bacterium]